MALEEAQEHQKRYIKAQAIEVINAYAAATKRR